MTDNDAYLWDDLSRERRKVHQWYTNGSKLKPWRDLNALEREEVAAHIARTDDGNEAMGKITFPELGLIWDSIRDFASN